jgi:hypothetical protein
MRCRENMVDGATVWLETRPIFPWSLLNCDLSDQPETSTFIQFHFSREWRSRRAWPFSEQHHKVLLRHLACFLFIIKRQKSVNVESEREPWLFRVNFQMCSIRRHFSVCAPLREEVLASIVPALIHSNSISKFICRAGPQRLECSPWMRNFFTVRCDRGRPEGGSSTEFFHCKTVTESSFH